MSERVRAHTRHGTSVNHQHHFLSRIAASASPVEGAIPGAGSSPLLNYVCFDVCFDVFIMVALCNRADHYIFMLWFVLLLYGRPM